MIFSELIDSDQCDIICVLSIIKYHFYTHQLSITDLVLNEIGQENWSITDNYRDKVLLDFKKNGKMKLR